jgi:hypothetical protein
MTAKFKSCLGAFGVGCAALLVSAAALAQTEPVSDTSANQIVVRDAASGKLRAATAAEARALTPERATAGAAVRLDTQQRSHFSGARGVRLSDQFMNHSVIARLADGSLVEQCFHTPEEALIAHKSITAQKTSTAAATE